MAASHGDPPLPATRRTGNRVEAWFGPEPDPVLQLAPLALNIAEHAEHAEH